MSSKSRPEHNESAYTQLADVTADMLGVRLRANRRHHSITSSARESSVGEMLRPIALAVLRLMASSIFVGCSTGRSPGFAPAKILFTKNAALLITFPLSMP